MGLCVCARQIVYIRYNYDVINAHREQTTSAVLTVDRLRSALRSGKELTGEIRGTCALQAGRRDISSTLFTWHSYDCLTGWFHKRFVCFVDLTLISVEFCFTNLHFLFQVLNIETDNWASSTHTVNRVVKLLWTKCEIAQLQGNHTGGDLLARRKLIGPFVRQVSTHTWKVMPERGGIPQDKVSGSHDPNY